MCSVCMRLHKCTYTHALQEEENEVEKGQGTAQDYTTNKRAVRIYARFVQLQSSLS